MSEIKNPISIFGVTFSKNTLKPIDEAFDICDIYDDDSLDMYMGKEVFKTDEDDSIRPFNYKLAIEVYRPEDETNEVWFTLYMVIHPNDLYEDNYLKRAYNPEDLDYIDSVIEGYVVTLAHTKFNLNETDETIETLTNAAGTASETVNLMRGFWLDRYANRLGNTGWDYIEHLLYGTPLLTLAEQRFDEQNHNN